MNGLSMHNAEGQSFQKCRRISFNSKAIFCVLSLKVGLFKIFIESLWDKKETQFLWTLSNFLLLLFFSCTSKLANKCV